MGQDSVRAPDGGWMGSTLPATSRWMISGPVPPCLDGFLPVGKWSRIGGGRGSDLVLLGWV